VNKRDTLLEEWEKAEDIPFKGWDFSYLEDKQIEDEPSISYMDTARTLIKNSSSMLDIGTGGGERLLEFKDVFPSKVAATEGYLPNLKLSREALNSYGIKVKYTDESLSSLLPYDDESFDLVLSRHSAYNISEVSRILKPGGIFFTKQVEGSSGKDLVEAFEGELKYQFFTLVFAKNNLEKQTNMIIEIAEEWRGNVRFIDVASIVYYLKAVPWIVANFSVKTHKEHLFKLQEKFERDGDLCFSSSYIFLKARKPVSL
jgi:SAM-dependent methyltransferase